jgi:hypothetical protein
MSFSKHPLHEHLCPSYKFTTFQTNSHGDYIIMSWNTCFSQLPAFHLTHQLLPSKLKTSHILSIFTLIMVLHLWLQIHKKIHKCNSQGLKVQYFLFLPLDIIQISQYCIHMELTHYSQVSTKGKSFNTFIFAYNTSLIMEITNKYLKTHHYFIMKKQ